MEDHDKDPLLAEAIARRDESRAMILQSRAQAGGTALDKLANAFGKMADQAAADARRSAEAADSIEPPRPDPEGTAQLLADSEGNFAANVEVAAIGGIGIKGSNSVGDTGQPAITAEEAGYAATASAQKIIGDQPVGDDLDTLSDDDLRARYQDVLGEKPHHAAGRATLIERIKAKQG
ncbi:MAG: hypothetical protein FJX25_05810 [Alphaproteobacteria bacterium]|nr:hypothetical protein [Alphaproteobacteria bacterium]